MKPMQQVLHTLLLVGPMAFLAGVVDAIAGGGGLILLPAYLAAGLPAHLAVGTNKCTSIAGTTVATARYIRQKKLYWPAALAAAATAFPGSYAGSLLNLYVPDRTMHLVLMVLLPVIGIALAFHPTLGEGGRWQRMPRRRLMAVCMGIGFVLGAYDGFFGPGSGTFMMLCFAALAGFDLVTANGNSKLVNLATNLASVVAFARAGSIWYAAAVPAALCAMAGGWVGSGLALSRGSKVIRPVYYAVLALLLGKVAFDFFGKV